MNELKNPKTYKAGYLKTLEKVLILINLAALLNILNKTNGTLAHILKERESGRQWLLCQRNSSICISSDTPVFYTGYLYSQGCLRVSIKNLSNQYGYRSYWHIITNVYFGINVDCYESWWGD